MSKSDILVGIAWLAPLIVLLICAINVKLDNDSLKYDIQTLEATVDKAMGLYSEVCEENKKLKKENKELKEEIESWDKLENVKLTAYCPCTECSGQWGTKTKIGTTAKEGRTIAVDPDVIPLGSEVKIGDKIYIAEDIGSAVQGKVIDVYFSEHKNNFRKYVDVLVRV